MRNIGIAMALLGAITWIQTRFGEMLYPVLNKILFWVLNVGIDYPDFIEPYVQISAWSGVFSHVALVGLMCLLLWSIVAKWLAR